ncbi:transglycosylase domain-containing protein [candidate division KSB1 bacterium]|nr:transglycosylase domain-containing protein [candidate division KSB1 bacterium]
MDYKRIIKFAAIGIASVIGVFITFAFIHSLFYISLETSEPSFLLVDRKFKFLAELGNQEQNYGYWPLPDSLPTRLATMTLAAEDRRFYFHPGVDLRSIARALHQNYISRESYSGASTIAMQVARLQTPANRGWYSKLRESYTALWLTLRFGREKVLRQYLTIAPYGNRIAGANYASRRYFQKPLVDLSWAEAALLAAAPKAPGNMNLFKSAGLQAAKKRAKLILDRAFQYKWITEEQWQQASDELARLVLPAKEWREYEALHAMLAIEKHLREEANRRHIILNPLNPTLQTSLDLDLQKAVQSILTGKISALRNLGASNVAVVVMKANTGEVLCYLGSEDYYNDTYAGSIDFVATPRSTGSLLKPFIFGLGMEWLGHTAATVLTDIGLDFGEGRNAFIPGNYDQKFLGPVLYKTALANSRNIPAIQVLKNIGVDHFYQHLAELGLTPDDGKADYYGLGLAIGGLYTSLQQLCEAYLVLANEGKRTPISWLANPALPSASKNIIRPDIAMQLQRFLSDPLARLPSFPRGGFLEYPYPVAIKTGTSQGYRDAWTIGWSDTYLVGVWIGHHDNLSMKKVSGYAHAAPIVKEIFSRLHPDRNEGLDDLGFPRPRDYRPMAICRLTGKLADRNTPYVSVDYFKPGTEPTEYSDVQKVMAIDKRNDLLASPSCPKKHIVYKKFVLLPSIFKDWAIAQGLPVPPVNYSPLCDNHRIIDDYQITITSPRDDSRFYLDPEMPADASVLALNCLVEPGAKDVLWLVDGEEFRVAPFPYKVNWPMQPGKYVFQAVVPLTAFKSEIVRVEIF